ncbi:hypothetical protein OS493_032434 [Desmophyllum pertusum]|uniref:Uncharacterized protein n=1 Tax=Desmophyllum pertusum TaxID=174260 RepID=A0A9X0D6J3_9CNID|nr:hypothetical protein OS493_032434 [Desmophyllum pertusum]
MWHSTICKAVTPLEMCEDISLSKQSYPFQNALHVKVMSHWKIVTRILSPIFANQRMPDALCGNRITPQSRITCEAVLMRKRPKRHPRTALKAI